MSAYNDDKPYSLDLVGAVLRQGSFVKKMYDLGWTKYGFFDGADHEIVLHRATARYHGFLDLLSVWPTVNSFCVPTLDIDLVWHTHQLHPTKYMQDTTRYVKRFIDHDDKVEGVRLSSAFDNTCKLWKHRFGIPYTHCGCPHPGQKAEDLKDPFSIGSRISRMLSFSSSNSSAEGPSRLESQQPQRTFKNLLIPSTDRPDAMIATHPSDHNAVRFTSKGVIAGDGFDVGRYRHERMSKKYDSLMKQRRKRAEKLEKRKKLLDQKVAKAGASGFTVSGVSKGPHSAELNNSASASSRERDRNGTATYSPYDIVFLAPIPLYYGAIGGCVPHDGGAVYNPTSGCGNCGSGGNCGGGCGSGGVDNFTSGDGSTCAGTTGTASGCGGCGGGCGGCGG
ncbi:hypothetical protein BJ165DRAFT_1514086 [Panaeolus papilionaceus]|nr:hypothetical protein BJ165DRAFT_1514086 [Panaeolus papilionaceus]